MTSYDASSLRTARSSSGFDEVDASLRAAAPSAFLTIDLFPEE
jgi:hypothetical protein